MISAYVDISKPQFGELPGWGLTTAVLMFLIVYAWFVTLPLRKYILLQDKKRLRWIYPVYLVLLFPLTYYVTYFLLGWVSTFGK